MFGREQRPRFLGALMSDDTSKFPLFESVYTIVVELERLRAIFPKRLKYSLGEKLSMQSIGADDGEVVAQFVRNATDLSIKVQDALDLPSPFASSIRSLNKALLKLWFEMRADGVMHDAIAKVTGVNFAPHLV